MEWASTVCWDMLDTGLLQASVCVLVHGGHTVSTAVLSHCRQCPGILSYHIACAATSRVVASSLDGLWVPQKEKEEVEEREELTRPGAAQLPKLQCMSEIDTKKLVPQKLVPLKTVCRAQ